MKTLCFSFVCLLTLTSVSGQVVDSKIRPGHNLLGELRKSNRLPAAAIEDFSFRDIAGKPYWLKGCLNQGPVVFVFMSSTCPLAKRYTLRLNRLSEKYSKRGVSVFAVFPNSDESGEGIREFSAAAKYPFPSVHDKDGYVTGKLNATMTPQAFLVDRQSKLQYRGAIDDSRYENRVKNTYLVDALDQVLSSQQVKTPQTNALGCTIHRDEEKEPESVTYSGHVARILQDNCMSCHREGQVAPFALTNYEQAKRWKTEIRKYTKARLMPPWKAAAGVKQYSNDLSISEKEIELIDRWVKQGAPMGNKIEIPPVPKFTDDWAFGKPDMIVEMPQEYVVGAAGEDDYRHFVIPYEAVDGKDKFITAVDVRPGNRNVVHHVIAYFDMSGNARKLDAAAKGPGYSRFGDVGFQPASILGGWAPGNHPNKTPLGTGNWLPKKGDIVLQVHYYRTGVEERDKTKIGLYFSKSPRTVPVRAEMAINKEFVIPSGKTDHRVKAVCQVKEDSYLFSITPHLHLIGEKVNVTAELPNGKTIPLVRIDDWDFNWQSTYYLKDLLEIPKGSVLRMEATFDNSADNPNNPNSPPVDIGWGDKTTDEMCVTFIGLLRKAEYGPIVSRFKESPSDSTKVGFRVETSGR